MLGCRAGCHSLRSREHLSSWVNPCDHGCMTAAAHRANAPVVVTLRRAEDAVAEQSYAAEAGEQRVTRTQRQQAARRRTTGAE